MLARLQELRGTFTWDLDDADLETLDNPEAPPFPASFAALACLSATSPEALTEGSFRFWMEQYSGPTAARWLGRFASGDPLLEEALKLHLRREEAAHPEVIFAEVLHRPEGRLGKVLARPQLRDHEIPFLARPGVPGARAILPSDLRVTVAGGRILLASERLGREVAPRLPSAHHFTQGPAAYRFLAHLQDQDGQPGGWSSGGRSRTSPSCPGHPRPPGAGQGPVARGGPGAAADPGVRPEPLGGLPGPPGQPWPFCPSAWCSPTVTTAFWWTWTRRCAWRPCTSWWRAAQASP